MISSSSLWRSVSIDTLLHRELEDIIKELPLIDEVGQALLGYENDYYKMLALVKAIECNRLKAVL